MSMHPMEKGHRSAPSPATYQSATRPHDYDFRVKGGPDPPVSPLSSETATTIWPKIQNLITWFTELPQRLLLLHAFLLIQPPTRKLPPPSR